MAASPCPGIARTGFGSTPGDSTRVSRSLSLRLPFRVSLAAEGDSRTHYAKGKRSPPKRLPQLCGRTISGLFHSPPGVLFAFPSWYWFAIGHRVVFSLGGWAPLIRPGFLVSRPTRDSARGGRGSATGLSPAAAGLSRPFADPRPPLMAVPRPRGTGPPVWANPLSLAATNGISELISFPRGTEMFHFPRFRPPALCVRAGVRRYGPPWVSPFGHPRIKGCVRLPGDFRGLPRPSSPRDAKASVVRPCAPGRTAPPRGCRAPARDLVTVVSSLFP